MGFKHEELSWKDIGFDYVRLLVLVVIVFVGIGIYNFFKTTVSYEHVITETYDNNYSGQSVDDDTGIYFTDEYIKDGESIKEGDRVIAIFDEDNTVDGLKYVEKKWKSE